jgi:hypothetical protein
MLFGAYLCSAMLHVETGDTHACIEKLNYLCHAVGGWTAES